MDDAFWPEHGRLQRVLERSLQKEGELLAVCRELKDQVVRQAIQVVAAETQRTNDEQTIEALRRQCAAATAEAARLRGRDALSKETLAALRRDVESLNAKLRDRDDALRALRKNVTDEPPPARPLPPSTTLFRHWKQQSRLLPDCPPRRAMTAPGGRRPPTALF